jgi:hypothetical protein
VIAQLIMTGRAMVFPFHQGRQAERAAVMPPSTTSWVAVM